MCVNTYVYSLEHSIIRTDVHFKKHLIKAKLPFGGSIQMLKPCTIRHFIIHAVSIKMRKYVCYKHYHSNLTGYKQHSVNIE